MNECRAHPAIYELSYKVRKIANMLRTFAARLQDKPGTQTRAAALLLLLALIPTLVQAQSRQVKIRIINAKTNQPIPNEKLNVALSADQIGSVAMPTDKNGMIVVDTKKATTIRILSNMYADCRPRGELYTNYSIDTILSTGITTGNLCSNASPKAKPGELILFEVPKAFIPNYPNPPASSLPHSDENPH
jgi:hypothetical protein